MASSNLAFPTSSSASFIINKKTFTPRAIEAVQKITHKQSHTSIPTTLDTEKAAAHAEEVEPSTALKDMDVQVEEESYDGDESDPDDGGVISNKAKEEATEMVLKPTEQDAAPEGEAGEEDGANPAKEPDDKTTKDECANMNGLIIYN